MKKIIFMIICLFAFTIDICAEKVEVEFSACVDGDTFKINLDDEIKYVRMLAVDTPETVKPGTPVQPYGKEASDFTCNKLTNAKKVELEYDDGSDKTDKYGRLLAWVYIDDNMIQKDLISLGYAKVEYIYGNYMYTDDLYVLENEAATNKLGIWSEEEYISKQSVDEEKDDESTSESFFEELKDLVSKYIKKVFNEILSEIKKSIKKAVNSVFD